MQGCFRLQPLDPNRRCGIFCGVCCHGDFQRCSQSNLIEALIKKTTLPPIIRTSQLIGDVDTGSEIGHRSRTGIDYGSKCRHICPPTGFSASMPPAIYRPYKLTSLSLSSAGPREGSRRALQDILWRVWTGWLPSLQ